MKVALLLSLVGGLAGCDGSGAPVLDVGCAASLRGPVEALAEDFEGRHGVRVRVSAAGSAEIARQVKAGAPIDVFVSAHPRWIEEVGRGDLRAVPVATNSLVLASRSEDGAGAIEPGDALPGWGPGARIAMGDPGHVPVGEYGREALESLGWWAAVEPRLVPTTSASAAARLLRMGEVDLLIGYATDVRGMEGISVRPIDPALHGRIEIVAADLGGDPMGAAFVEALGGADELFARHGFAPAGVTPRVQKGAPR